MTSLLAGLSLKSNCVASSPGLHHHPVFDCSQYIRWRWEWPGIEAILNFAWSAILSCTKKVFSVALIHQTSTTHTM